MARERVTKADLYSLEATINRRLRHNGYFTRLHVEKDAQGYRVLLRRVDAGDTVKLAKDVMTARECYYWLSGYWRGLADGLLDSVG